MAKTIKKGKKNFYQCSICKLFYKERKWAEQCQKWCKTHKGTCDSEASMHAVMLK